MLLIVGVQIDTELDELVAGYAVGAGELNGAPPKNMDRMLIKADEKYNLKGDVGRGLDIMRRSFTGETSADHNKFAAPMITDAPSPKEVVFFDYSSSSGTSGATLVADSPSGSRIWDGRPKSRDQEEP